MTEYNQSFFDLVESGATNSAKKIVPLVNKLVQPKSVLDIGGGNGAWLKMWLKSGVKDALVVDGDYVDTTKLLIPKNKFKHHDLTTPLDLKRKFDLVMTLEVAEHLENEYAEIFVETLTRHSEVVLFSAALPGQSGVHHVNERWASYWAGLFAARKYKVYDILRPVIWEDKGIEPWYKQNCLIFATDRAAKRLHLTATDTPLDIVHPELFTFHLEQKLEAVAAASSASKTIRAKTETDVNQNLKDVLKKSSTDKVRKRMDQLKRKLKR